MPHTYEIEIKSLLGSKDAADKLISDLKRYDKNLKLVEEESQLNHYFNIPFNIDLTKALEHLIPSEKKDLFDETVKEGKKISVRTRSTNDKKREKVMFVIKASLGDDSSDNGVKRIEFELQVDMSLEALDKILLGAGLTYQAKWSRERREYVSGDVHICLDKNAGYGYLAEFEKITVKESDLESIKKELLAFMKNFGVYELPQDRIERMFSHYNSHWEEYYGTEKTFNLD